MTRLGAVLWVVAAAVTALTDALTVVDLFVLLGATIVVPRAALLLGWRQPPAVVVLVGWVGVTLGLAADPGLVAGLLTLPWVAAVAWTAITGLWPARVPDTLVEVLPLAAGAWAIVGATSATASASGLTAFGIEEPIVRLTAVHYLVAGMGATTLGWRICRERGAFGRVGAHLTAAVPPVVALGFVTSHPIPQVGGALLLTVGVYLIAAAGAASIADLRGRFPKVLQAASSAAVVAPMVLAVFWAAAQHADVPALSIPDMARIHGTLNGVGFVGCGLTAWLLHDGLLHLPSARTRGRGPGRAPDHAEQRSSVDG